MSEHSTRALCKHRTVVDRFWSSRQQLASCIHQHCLRSQVQLASKMGAKASPEKKKRLKPLLENGMDGLELGNSKFARALGSVDYQTRERGVQALTRFLQRKQTSELKESDMLKLWKGLYFCFWHSDKVPVQMDLAQRLADVMSSLSEEVAYLYFSCFLTTLRREWILIDRLRLDKFLMLARKFVAAMLGYLGQHSWRGDLISRYMSLLRDGVLMPNDNLVALGLAYHVADVFVPELKNVMAKDSSNKRPAASAPSSDVLLQLLGPFIDTTERAPEQAMVNRLKEAVWDELVAELRDEDEEQEEEQEGSEAAPPKLLSIVSPADLAALLFERGAAPEVRARNRAALYQVSQALEKESKKRARREEPAGGASQPKMNGTVAAGAKKQQQPSSAVTTTPTPAAGASNKAKKQVADKQDNGSAAGAQTTGPQQQQSSASAGQQQQQGDGAGEPAPAPSSAASKKRKRKEAKQAAAAAAAMAIDEGPLQTESPVMGLVQTPTQGQGTLPAGGSTTPAAAAKVASKAAAAAAEAASAALAVAAEQQQRQSSSKKGAAGSGPAVTAVAVAVATTPVTSPAPLKANPSATPQPTPSNAGSGGKQSKQQALSQQVTPVTAGPGASGSGAAAAQPPPSTAKKGVKINLKKNLYFAVGAPLPDPMVRTPPSARSAGGILKKSSLVGLKPNGVAHLAREATTTSAAVTPGSAKARAVAKAMAAQARSTPNGRQQGKGSGGKGGRGGSDGLQLNILGDDSSKQPVKDWPPFKVSQGGKGQQQPGQKAPGSAPAKLAHGGANKGRVLTPGSVKRARAADLFSP